MSETNQDELSPSVDQTSIRCNMLADDASRRATDPVWTPLNPKKDETIKKGFTTALYVVVTWLTCFSQCSNSSSATRASVGKTCAQITIKFTKIINSYCITKETLRITTAHSLKPVLNLKFFILYLWLV